MKEHTFEVMSCIYDIKNKMLDNLVFLVGFVASFANEEA